MKDYEEKTSFDNLWGWISLFLLSFFVLGWAMVIMFSVKDVPRKWDYGSVIDAPSENINTTIQQDKNEKDKQQIETLPGIKIDSVQIVYQNKFLKIDSLKSKKIKR